MLVNKFLQKSLLKSIQYGIRCRIPDFRLTKEVKKQVYFKNVRPTQNWFDPLVMPGVTDKQILGLYESVRKETEIVFSSENIGFVLYQFDRLQILTEQVMNILSPQLRRYSQGEYPVRTVFGGIFVALKANNQQYLDFFTNQLEASAMQFTPDQILEIGRVLNMTELLTPEDKLSYFESHFGETLAVFMESEYKETDINRTINMIKVLSQLGYFQERVWNPIFNRFWKQRGFKKVTAYQNVLPYVDMFPLAAQLAVHLKQKLQHSVDINWRFNIEEGRYYTNHEMILKSQDNIKLVPETCSFFPTKLRQSVNRKFQRLLSQGTLKEQKQIEEDKAKALGYAILNRYQKADDEASVDVLGQNDYEKMFGMNEGEMDDFVDILQKVESADTKNKKK